MARPRTSPSPAASTPRTRSNTSRTVASCLMCCAALPRARRSDAVVFRGPLPADHLEIAALIESLIPRYLARDLTAEGIAIIRENAQAGMIGARLGGLAPPVWSFVFVVVVGCCFVGF